MCWDQGLGEVVVLMLLGACVVQGCLIKVRNGVRAGATVLPCYRRAGLIGERGGEKKEGRSGGSGAGAVSACTFHHSNPELCPAPIPIPPHPSPPLCRLRPRSALPSPPWVCPTSWTPLVPQWASATHAQTRSVSPSL